MTPPEPIPDNAPGTSSGTRSEDSVFHGDAAEKNGHATANPTPSINAATSTKRLSTERPSKATKLLSDDAAREQEEYARLDAQDWAEGENRFTRFLRALFCLVAGTYLLWTQQNAPISTGVQWNRWIALSVVVNAVIPLGIVWLFFAQGLRLYDYHKYLPDQKIAAWRYGWSWKPFSKHLRTSLILFGVMLPVLIWASRDEGTRAFYRAYFPPTSDAGSWLWLAFTITVYMACWEWFFRGFLLFGLAQGTGAVVAIVLQAALFGWSHGGKPGLEMASSFAGGLILGAICWRDKSFVPAFLTHAFIHVTWAFLILKF
jgi:membrane protease YdiL (CAAX protease family)